MKRAVIVALNVAALVSSAFDACHLYFAIAEYLQIPTVTIVTDDVKAVNRILLSESKRLREKGILMRDHTACTIVPFAGLDTLKPLVQGGNVLLTLSAHGYTGIPDAGESDGRGEYIVAGSRIRDDDLYNLVAGLPGTNLLLADTCSSGTMFDLPYVLDVSSGKVRQENNNRCKSSLVCISACRDGASAQDDISEFGFGGKGTSAVLSYLYKERELALPSLLKYIQMNARDTVISFSNKGAIPSSLSYGGNVSFVSVTK